jgi:multicomponent Na+:H+ antiporter subunit D
MPILFLLLPVICIFILNLPRRCVAAKLAPWVVGIVSFLQMVFAATSQMDCWQPFSDLLTLPLPVGLTVDVISAGALFTIALGVATANAVGIRGDARARVITSSLMLMCMTGMNGVVMVRDLFSLYIFLEITALSAFVLIASEKKLTALVASFKYFILSGLASLSLILANALVFMEIGGLSFAEVLAALDAHNVVVQVALVLYVVAFCIKSGTAPFHGWLPEAYSQAPSAISVLLAGTTTKVAGVYVIIRLMSDVFVGFTAPSLAFMILGSFSIVIGAFGAIAQTDMKRMLAFSSISQLGYIVLAAGLATPLALIGALVHFVNHALFKSLLFVNAAAVEEQTGTTNMGELGGLTERLKVTGWTSVIGFLSTVGIPPFSGFWSKLLIVIALGVAGQWFFVALAILMSLVSLSYFLIMQRKVFFGKLREGFEELREARGTLVGTSLVLAGLTTCLGLLFPVVLVIFNNFGLV